MIGRWLVAIAVACAPVACAPAAPPRFPAKPPGCALETVKALPQRPYLELETFNLPSLESIRDVLDKIGDRACQDGADAVYAPKGGKTYSYAIALKWNDAPSPATRPRPPAPRSPSQRRRRARRPRPRRRARAASPPAPAPPAPVAARARAATRARAARARASPRRRRSQSRLRPRRQWRLRLLLRKRCPGRPRRCSRHRRGGPGSCV